MKNQTVSVKTAEERIRQRAQAMGMVNAAPGAMTGFTEASTAETRIRQRAQAMGTVSTGAGKGALPLSPAGNTAEARIRQRAQAMGTAGAGAGAQIGAPLPKRDQSQAGSSAYNQYLLEQAANIPLYTEKTAAELEAPRASYEKAKADSDAAKRYYRGLTERAAALDESIRQYEAQRSVWQTMGTPEAIEETQKLQAMLDAAYKAQESIQTQTKGFEGDGTGSHYQAGQILDDKALEQLRREAEAGVAENYAKQAYYYGAMMQREGVTRSREQKYAQLLAQAQKQYTGAQTEIRNSLRQYDPVGWMQEQGYSIAGLPGQGGTKTITAQQAKQMAAEAAQRAANAGNEADRAREEAFAQGILDNLYVFSTPEELRAQREALEAEIAQGDRTANNMAAERRTAQAARAATKAKKAELDKLNNALASQEAAQTIQATKGTETGKLIQETLRTVYDWKEGDHRRELQYRTGNFEDKALSEIKKALLADGVDQQAVENTVETLRREIHAEWQRQQAETLDEQMRRSGFGGWLTRWAYTLASVPMNLASPVGMLAPVATALNGSDYSTVDPNSAWFGPSNTVNSIRETHQKYNAGGELNDMLYGIITSSMDSVLGSMVGSGITGGLGLTGKAAAWVGGSVIGAEAAAQSMQDIAARGGSVEQVLSGGLMAGAFETFFEQFSLAQLNSLAQMDLGEAVKAALGHGGGDVKAVLRETIAKNVAKGMLTNGSEELFTELANVLYDRFAMGDVSNYGQKVRDYMALGLSEEEARKRTSRDLANQVLEAGFTGALQGLLMDSVALAYNGVNSRAQGREDGRQTATDSDMQTWREQMRNFWGADALAQAEQKNNASGMETGLQVPAVTGSTDEKKVIVYSGQSALNSKKGLAYTLASNIWKIEDMGVVAKLTGHEMKSEGSNASQQIRSFFTQIGNVVFRKNFGSVSFGEYGLGGILTHRPLNRAKMVSLTAVPEVIKNGRIIQETDNWKGRGYKSYVFAAPVEIAGERVYVAAVVDQRPDNKFYLNEVVDSNGNFVRIEEAPSDGTKSGITAQGGITATPERGISNSSQRTGITDNTIPQTAPESNTQNQAHNLQPSTLEEAYVRQMYRDAGPGSKDSGTEKLRERMRMVYGEETTAVANGAEVGYTNQNDNLKGAEQSGETAVHLRDGSQRAGGTHPGEQIPAMAQGTGGNQIRQTAAQSADGGTARLTYGEKVSTASLGIGNGSAQANIRLVTGGENAFTKAAKQIAKERGLQLVLFSGDNLRILQPDGSWASVRGYISGDRVFVRVDHPYFTADQIMRHEAGHDMIAKGEVDIDAVRQRIAERYDPHQAAQLYTSAYEGTGLSADGIWEEIICDSLGDMNIFADTVAEGTAHALLTEMRKAVEDTRSVPARGPPSAGGKYSREYSDKLMKWAVDIGILTEKDRISFFHTIADISKRNYKVRRSSQGGYIVDLGNKLLFTDGNWESPTLSSVIIFDDTGETSMRIAKDVIFNGTHTKAGYEQARQIIESAYWPGYVERYTAQNSGSYARQDAGGERADSGETAERIQRGVNEKYSREYWRSDLTQAQMERLLRWVDYDIQTSENRICDTANWTFTKFEGLPIFAVYSTESKTDHTILYEVKGDQAEFEKACLVKRLEEIDDARNHDGKSKIIDEVLSRSRVRNDSNIGDDNRTVVRGSSSGDAGVLRQQPGRKPSPAFESVLRNILADRENRVSEKYSRDLEERRRALQKGEMVNQFRKRINWPAYYKELTKAEYNPNHYDDGEIAIMYLDGSCLTLQMQRNGEWSVIGMEEKKSYGDGTERNRATLTAKDGQYGVSRQREIDGYRGTPGRAGGDGTHRGPAGQGSNDAGDSEISAADFEKTGSADTGHQSLTPSYSREAKYWKPKLTKAEWGLLNRSMEWEIGQSSHYLDEATKWLYANEKGEAVFAIYGIGDGTEATPLYASGGKLAESDYQLFAEFGSDYQLFAEFGKEIEYGIDRSAESISRWFKTSRYKQRKSNGGMPSNERRNTATGHDRVSSVQRQRDGRGSAGYGIQTGGDGNLTESNGRELETRYWKPKLTHAEWDLLNRSMEREIGQSSHYLDEATKWLYANEKGETVFAFYGIGDGTEAMPLYASGGKQALADGNRLNDYLEEAHNGIKSRRTAVDRFLEHINYQQGSTSRNLYDLPGTRDGDVPVSYGQSGDNGLGSTGQSQNAGSDRELTPSYSRELEPVEQLRERNKLLLERVKYWKGQPRLSDQKVVDPGALQKAVRDNIYRGVLAGIGPEPPGAQRELAHDKSRLQSQYEAALRQARNKGDPSLANALYRELVRIQKLKREDDR